MQHKTGTLADVVFLIIGMPVIGTIFIGLIVAMLAVIFIKGTFHVDADLKNKKGSVEAKPTGHP